MSIYQLTVKGVTSLGSQLRNVHHYEFPGYVPTAVELQEAVDALAAHYDTRILPLTSDNVSHYGIDARRVDIGDLPTAALIPATWPADGGEAGDQLPDQIAALVTWKAPTTFPRSTRSYLFPFSENQNGASGGWAAAVITALDAFGTEMETLAITGQTDANKVAVEYGGDPRAVVASNVVSQTPAPGRARSQRRRRVGVGI